jgi:hypothetical protein
MLGHERSGRRQTAGAHWNAGNFAEGGAADAAVVGENERKKDSRNPSDSVGVDVWRCCIKPSTREDPPPPENILHQDCFRLASADRPGLVGEVSGNPRRLD